MKTVKADLTHFCQRSDAATAIEYGLIIGILSAALIPLIGISGDRIAVVFDFILQDFGSGVSSSTSTSSGS